MQPSSSPSDSPSSQPSLLPSSKPSLSPTVSYGPTVTPSYAPSQSASPTSLPSTSPSDVPSLQPSIVIETVTTVGALSTNQEFCSMGGAEQAAFKESTITTIRGLVCSNPNDDSCTAEITYACGRESRRELSTRRLLQSATSWQLEYEVVNTFTCHTASCSSASDLAAVVSISNFVSMTIATSLSSGSFVVLLSTALAQTVLFDLSIVTCLVVWGNIEPPQTEVGGAHTGSGTATGKFYPDWEHCESRTCLEDGNEPLYMANDATTWLSDSLIECCLRFYQVCSSYLIR
jgi:hypothetical protein